jgi:hypothetical protein
LILETGHIGFQEGATKGNWLDKGFEVIKLALLEVVEEDLLLLAVAHAAELGQFIHLENREGFLVVLLLFL